MRSILAMLLTLGCIAALPTHGAATCFCMMRPPSPVLRARGINEDPSYNPASAVVMVRDGRRVVLTIEAAYEGPPTELSLVVPVPSAIGREGVRTVSGTVFRRLDQRTAPRVRHVFPRCAMGRGMPRAASAEDASAVGGGRAAPPADDFGVVIEDEWPVDEYDVTLLSAEESTGLLAFLRERGLDLPDAAATMLRGYIETGHRFVVFRADPARAQRLGDTMMLSPLQLEYDSEELRVPVRLGTLNSPGEQELLLYVISTEGRFEIANRPGVIAPTDLRMRRDARGAFAELYTSITDEIFRRTPGAAITEYVHPVGTHVRRSEIAPFGAVAEGGGGRGEATDGRTWTVTRIRHRYGTDLADDLTLREAEPLTMERRFPRWPELRVRPRRDQSAFHVQYVVEHTGCTDEWTHRRIARRFATAESMWEARHDLWPGEVIVDPIPLLGIEPGSSAPAGWPPPPPPPPAAEPVPVAEAAPPAPAPAAPPAARATSSPGAATGPASAPTTGLCAIRPERAPGDVALVLGALGIALVVRRRRRGVLSRR